MSKNIIVDKTLLNKQTATSQIPPSLLVSVPESQVEGLKRSNCTDIERESTDIFEYDCCHSGQKIVLRFSDCDCDCDEDYDFKTKAH